MNIRSNDRLNWKTMSRPAENTRGAIIKAAVYLFAEKGFQSTSVRESSKHASIRRPSIIISKAKTDCTLKSSKPPSRS
jgi:Bacterial regulatory proteins, tetR family